jgi:hypothetical protein
MKGPNQFEHCEKDEFIAFWEARVAGSCRPRHDFQPLFLLRLRKYGLYEVFGETPKTARGTRALPFLFAQITDRTEIDAPDMKTTRCEIPERAQRIFLD